MSVRGFSPSGSLSCGTCALPPHAVSIPFDTGEFGSVVAARYWHQLDDGRLQCDVCPRHCRLGDGQRGLCFVRANHDSQMVLTTWGRSSGFCIDPIEKKPLNHFLPGTPILSFGTAGCNLTCKFCQNWDISKSRQTDTLADAARPEQLVQAARQLGCRSLAYTYNDPVIFLEYAVDVAHAAREQDVRSVAVTAGYVEPEAASEFFLSMDAANIDLKAFTERFYHKTCGGHLQAVLETLEYLKHETRVWFELTTLLIPGENDSTAEIEAMTQWVLEHLGNDVPMHFTAFHPDYKMRELPRTSMDSLLNARHIALKNGVRHVWTGNCHDKGSQSSYCHHCGGLLIGRDGYRLSDWNLDERGGCRRCGTRCAGVFEAEPGRWGARRQPVRLSSE